MSSSSQSSPPHGAPLVPSSELDTLRRALGGQYAIERQLGAGGMGSVYLARDVTLDRLVAVKVIVPELASAASVRERFLREARTVARLRHPNVVAVYAAGEADGLLYFVMEYVPGESLRDRLARGRYDDAAAITALRDLARALGAAHAQGIVHRDVKPENVLLDAETGRAMLTDFGVARAFDAGGADERMTGTGFVVGSPRYMSPEQAAGERELDGRSDVYSLGLVGYEMFAGEPAVSGGSAASIIMRQITERPAPLTTRNDHVPPAVASVVERALEKKPEDRWPTANEMADALDGALLDPTVRTASLPGAARTTVRQPSRGARTRWLAAAAVLLGVAAVGGWWALGRGGAPRGVDPRKSYLVVPFDVQSPDPRLQWLREGAVSMLSLDLAQWRDLTVVDYERGLDLLRDLKLDDVRRLGREDAIRLAKRAGVWSVVTGRVIDVADSTLVVATVYDVASGNKVDSAQTSAPRAADPRPMFDALAQRLLRIAGAPGGTQQALAQQLTTSVDAYRDYLSGVRALNAWQFARADSLFAAATEADSAFALAYYKRALTWGWWKAGDTAQVAFIRTAVQNAGRLPPRERRLLDAYATFATAMYESGADSTRMRRFAEAQRKWADAVAQDSTDAEAWYGLGDAYYHNTTGDWSDSLSRDHWTRALAAFNRTLALDSTFHLAYSHKLGIFQFAGGPLSPLVLDGEVLRSLNDPATRQAFQGERLAAAKARAKALGVREARAWAAADPVPMAFAQLAQAYLPAHWDSAVAVLDDAVRRVERGAATRLVLYRPTVVAHVDPARAAALAREALRTVDSAALVADGGTERFQQLVMLMPIAAMGGQLGDVDAAARLATTVRPTDPSIKAAMLPVIRGWGAATQLAAGAPPAALRAPLNDGLAAIDRLAGPIGDQIRRQSMMAAYVAFAATREPRYVDLVRRWRGGADTTTWPEMVALRALAADDTAAARAAVRRFPSIDSVRSAGALVNGARWAVRGEVYSALGDLRSALACYELIDPSRFGDSNGFDVNLVFYVRSVLARARVREQLGDRAGAAADYARFAAWWANADPAVQPQLREAQAGLARVRDARASQPVR